MSKLIFILLSTLLTQISQAAPTCTDFSGRYRRVDDSFLIEWQQPDCSSQTVTENYWGNSLTITILTDGTFRQISTEPALKAHVHVNGKLVYSLIRNDLQETMTVIYTKTAEGLKADVTRCKPSSCQQTVDVYQSY